MSVATKREQPGSETENRGQTMARYRVAKNKESYKGKMFNCELFQLVYYDQIVFFSICSHRQRGTYFVYEVEADVIDKDGYLYYRPLVDNQKGRWLIKLPQECLVCNEEENSEAVIKEYNDVIGMPIKLEHSKDMKIHWFTLDINKDTKLYKNVSERLLKEFPRPTKKKVLLVYSGNDMNFTPYQDMGRCAWTYRKVKKLAPANSEVIATGLA